MTKLMTSSASIRSSSVSAMQANNLLPRPHGSQATSIPSNEAGLHRSTAAAARECRSCLLVPPGRREASPDIHTQLPTRLTLPATTEADSLHIGRVSLFRLRTVRSHQLPDQTSRGCRLPRMAVKKQMRRAVFTLLSLRCRESPGMVISRG